MVPIPLHVGFNFDFTNIFYYLLFSKVQLTLDNLGALIGVTSSVDTVDISDNICFYIVWINKQNEQWL